MAWYGQFEPVWIKSQGRTGGEGIGIASHEEIAHRLKIPERTVAVWLEHGVGRRRCLYCRCFGSLEEEV